MATPAQLSFLTKGKLNERLRSMFKLGNNTLHPRVAALVCELENERPVSLLYHSKEVSDVEAIQTRQTLFDSLLEAVRESGVPKASYLGDVSDRKVILVVPITLDSSSDPSHTSACGASGAYALCVEGLAQEEIPSRLSLLQSFAAIATLAGGESLQTAQASEEDDSGDRFARSLALSSPKEMAYQLANSLAQKYSCEQVAVGAVKRSNVEVLCFSGATDVKKSSPGTIQAAQAMAECVDNAAVVCHPVIEGTEAVAATLHAKWSNATDGSQIVSLPLRDSNGTTGVISLRRNRANPFSQADVSEIGERIAPFGQAITSLAKANRSLRGHLWESLTAALTPSSRKAIKLSVLILALVGLLSFFGADTDFRPTFNAELKPTVSRQVACPFEAVLKELHVREGQYVEEGDVLLEFDPKKLEVEREVIRSQISEAMARLNQTLHSADPDAMAVERARLDVLRSKLDAVDDKLNSLVLRAPMAGLVTRCELATKIGQPFRFGDPMLELVDCAGWNIEVEIPESLIAELQTCSTGCFIPFGRPDESYPFDIVSIRGAAEQNDGKNVFVASAQLAERTEWMRSGMKGLAKVEAGKQPTYWVWFHDAIDWFNLHCWQRFAA
ncbi:MAG: biotin/lipoyl-binding protein [Aureliella sp.]